jgi:hypothetical protein
LENGRSLNVRAERSDLGSFNVKGFSELVRVFELRGLGPHRTRLDVSRARGLTRFVGRDNDLEALETALAQCTEGRGQVVGMVGEAGVGKSRLCFEFLERCRARGLRVLEGQEMSDSGGSKPSTAGRDELGRSQ